MATTRRYDVKDIGLAEEGIRRIAWADRNMPVLAAIRERFEREEPLAGYRIARLPHVTTETANLVRTLKAGGADVVLCAVEPAVHPGRRRSRARRPVRRPGLRDQGRGQRHLLRAHRRGRDKRPQMTMDDGADVVGVLHGDRRDLLPEVIGGTEETTTGVIRLRAMEADGQARLPDRRRQRGEDQAHVRQPLRHRPVDARRHHARDEHAARREASSWSSATAGAGAGVAMRAKGMGAHVIVCEVDPLRALEAVMDGFGVMPDGRGRRGGDIFVTVTGNSDVDRRRALRGDEGRRDRRQHGPLRRRDRHPGARGDVRRARAGAPATSRSSRCKDGRQIYLLAEGRLVNLAAAEGHPAAVMDMSFANQALAAEYMVKKREEAREAGLRRFPWTSTRRSPL